MPTYIEAVCYIFLACLLLSLAAALLIEGLASRHRRKTNLSASLDEHQRREWRAGCDAPTSQRRQFGHYVGKYGDGRKG